MSLNTENAIKEILDQIHGHRLTPHEELNIAERLLLTACTIVLAHQAKGNLTQSRGLAFAHTMRQNAETLIVAIPAN